MDNQENKFEDYFCLCLDASSSSVLSSIMFITDILGKKHHRAQIHVIDYRSSLSNYYLNKKEKDDLVFPEKIEKSLDFIEGYIKSMAKEDFIIINGIDRLEDEFDSQKLFKSEFGNITHSIHLKTSVDYTRLLSQLDNLYSKYQLVISGIVSIMYADFEAHATITNALMYSNNMSIVKVYNEDPSDPITEIMKQQFEIIGKSSFKEALDELNKVKAKLPELNYDILQANLYFKSGQISKSASLFDKHYANLQNEEKLHLANIHIELGHIVRAEEILLELFEKDKYLNNLYSTFYKLYNDNEEKQNYWIEVGYSIDPNNLWIMECYANYLSHKTEYTKAATLFRKIGERYKKEYFELIARIQEVLNEEYTDPKEIEQYLIAYANDNDNLRNEAIYRLAGFYKLYKKSDYLCYNCLRKAKLEYNLAYSCEIIIEKINILSDEKRATKALGKLKPHKKEKDATKLLNSKVRLAFEAIKVLSNHPKGYLHWRKLIDTLDKEQCLESAYEYLKREIPFYNDTESFIHSSKIHRLCSEKAQRLGIDKDSFVNNPEQTSINLLKLLQNIKMGFIDLYQNFNDENSFIQAILTPVELLCNDYLRTICRYYISIILANHGIFQKANEFSLSISEYSVNNNDELKLLALYLSLLSWGYNQYRIGRKHEGIMCIIAASYYCRKTNEIKPFLEEGINIISLYLSENDCIREKFVQDLEFWNDFSNKINTLNSNLSQILSLINQDTYSQLTQFYNNIEKKGQDWEGDLVNVSMIHFKQKEYSKAICLIKSYGNEALKQLDYRRDIRYKVAYSWAFNILVTGNLTIEDICLTLKFIELSYKDIEEQRTVSHIEERSELSNYSNKIMKLYFDILLIVENSPDLHYLKDYSSKKQKELLFKLSPRSIIEQKNLYSVICNEREYKPLQDKYDIQLQEYKSAQKSGESFDSLNNMAIEINEIKNKLIKCHPHYMKLKDYEAPTIESIQEHLEDNDVVYMNYITAFGVIEYIINNKSVRKEYNNCNTIELQSLINKFCEILQEINKATDELQSITERIIECGFPFLSNFIEKQNQVSTLFFILDSNYKMFSLSNIKLKDKYIIERVNALIRLLDLSSLLNNQRFKAHGIINRCIGNNKDSSISLITKTISNYIESKNSSDIILLENNCDNTDNIKEAQLHNKAFNVVIMYGHGDSAQSSHSTSGAYRIEGSNKSIDMSDLLNGIKCNCLVLVSCSSGISHDVSLETSNGVLNSILEHHSGLFIVCRWDVSTQETLELLNLFIEYALKGVYMREALILAQREMHEKYNDKIALWCGLEMWLN